MYYIIISVTFLRSMAYFKPFGAAWLVMGHNETWDFVMFYLFCRLVSLSVSESRNKWTTELCGYVCEWFPVRYEFPDLLPVLKCFHRDPDQDKAFTENKWILHKVGTHIALTDVFNCMFKILLCRIHGIKSKRGQLQIHYNTVWREQAK